MNINLTFGITVSWDKRELAGLMVDSNPRTGILPTAHSNHVSHEYSWRLWSKQHPRLWHPCVLGQLCSLYWTLDPSGLAQFFYTTALTILSPLSACLYTLLLCVVRTLQPEQKSHSRRDRHVLFICRHLVSTCRTNESVNSLYGWHHLKGRHVSGPPGSISWTPPLGRRCAQGYVWHPADPLEVYWLLQECHHTFWHRIRGLHQYLNTVQFD